MSIQTEITITVKSIIMLLTALESSGLTMGHTHMKAGGMMIIRAGKGLRKLTNPSMKASFKKGKRKEEVS